MNIGTRILALLNVRAAADRIESYLRLIIVVKIARAAETLIGGGD